VILCFGIEGLLGLALEKKEKGLFESNLGKMVRDLLK